MKILRTLESIKEISEPIAIAIGLFDGLHLGHRRVVETALEAAKNDNCKSAVLTFNMSVDNAPVHKNITKRIISEDDFVEKLENMGIDYLISAPFENIKDLSPQEFVDEILDKHLNAKYISCGEDFRFGKKASGSITELTILARNHDISVKAAPLVIYKDKPISSSRIRQCIETGQIPDANDMLGYRYTIDFEVVGGNRIGRTLGKPTINQPYPDGYVLPRFGVYATLTKVGEKWYTSVTNVGVKPTIGEYNTLAETYIQGFEGDLYGKKVRVEFLQFLRNECKFASLEELRLRIEQDSAEARALGLLYI